MLFYKPIVSLVVAFAAASSVAASATPVARTEYPPPSPPPPSVNQCNQADTFCCTTKTNSQNPLIGVLAPLLVPFLKVDLIQGLGCINVLSGGTCNTQQVCCEKNNQAALVAINCSPITIL